MSTAISQRERTLLGDLAQQVAEIAALPAMAERRERWRLHNRQKSERPLVFINPQGAWVELIPPETCTCSHEKARWLELLLRKKIYEWQHFTSDNAFEGRVVVNAVVHDSGWGLTRKWLHSDQDRGAVGFDPVLLEPADTKKLRVPQVQYDDDATRAEVALIQELVGDALPVVAKANYPGGYHLMNQYSGWRGLNQTLIDLIDNPNLVHEVMAFLEDAHRQLLQQYLAQGLLHLNNDDTIIYTSGYGYTDELPAGAGASSPRPEDLWCWAEAQEMAVVSPEMHEAFVFPYEKRLLEPFGLVGYGCCDDLTEKLDFVLTIPKLRRVSVCPWADVEKCAQRLNTKTIFMWKPQPSFLAGGFDPGVIRDYIRRTVDAARDHDCTLEMALLDTHTCGNHPERFEIWSQIAMDEAEKW